MDLGVTVEEDTLKIHEEEFGSRSGYIYDIQEDEDKFVITITTEKQTEETFNYESTDRTIVTVLKGSTIVIGKV